MDTLCFISGWLMCTSTVDFHHLVVCHAWRTKNRKTAVFLFYYFESNLQLQFSFPLCEHPAQSPFTMLFFKLIIRSIPAPTPINSKHNISILYTSFNSYSNCLKLRSQESGHRSLFQLLYSGYHRIHEKPINLPI